MRGRQRIFREAIRQTAAERVRGWNWTHNCARVSRVKIVGRRMTTLDLGALGPLESLRRATELQRQADQINPYPRPRGFVFKARTWEDYARWRREQPNPRLW